MADARTVANRFLELAKAKEQQLTQMQLLKLVYIAHGWMLGLSGRRLIDQPIEAWQYGPVVRDIYNATRGAGREPVYGPLWAPSGALDGEQDDMIRQVFDLYGNMSGIALSNITHMPNTPWALTYKPGAFGTPIDDGLIAAHYRRLAKERREAA